MESAEPIDVSDSCPSTSEEINLRTLVKKEEVGPSKSALLIGRSSGRKKLRVPPRRADVSQSCDELWYHFDPSVSGKYVGLYDV
jgi:hypothetical protein